MRCMDTDGDVHENKETWNTRIAAAESSGMSAGLVMIPVTVIVLACVFEKGTTA